ncbi:uncharacterized protein F5147DRAFT_775000 [Suillus discolor]|uniref:Uncharacterized protein n=1 Tax=Suillus discolor TaxID=1912936 RepID=A0A9P7F480_9AGAM|nr:uncharacterized protein F5147DRAFT_775000 [Suillus discolor]KAG2106187.1 hypothetical protein F5147DRAFT_775000 [Suillus discolor]
MDIHLQPTAPVYLYTPQLGRVLQVIPPPNAQHPFVDFNGPERFILGAYLAYCQVSPIYCPDYVLVNSLDGVLPVVGTLAIPHHDETLFHTVYKKQFGDSDFLRAIDAQFCRPNGAGMIIPVWQFSSTIENRLSDMHKVVRGCIRLDDFSGGGTVQEQEARIKALFDSFNPSDQQDIEQAIAELVELHMFRELMWMATFQTVISLAEGTRDGRVADLFPQEVRGENLALAKCFAATLLTIIYHTFHLGQPLKTRGRKPGAVYCIILTAITHMYANLKQYPTFMKTMVGLTFLRAPNVLPMDPKIQAPKVSAYEKRARTVADCSPIKQVEVNLPDLPYAEFTSIRYARTTEIVDNRCFL